MVYATQGASRLRRRRAFRRGGQTDLCPPRCGRLETPLDGVDRHRNEFSGAAEAAAMAEVIIDVPISLDRFIAQAGDGRKLPPCGRKLIQSDSPGDRS